MKPTLFGRTVLFLLSYYILFVFLICDYDVLNNEISFWKILVSWKLIIFTILTLFVILASLYLFKWRKLPKRVFEITKVQNLSAETLNYLITIIMGLFFFTGNESLLKLVILLVLLFLVYQAGGVYYLQPLLMLFGFKVYKCSIENGNEIMIITKKKPKLVKIEMNELFDDVFILKETKE